MSMIGKGNGHHRIVQESGKCTLDKPAMRGQKFLYYKNRNRPAPGALYWGKYASLFAYGGGFSLI